jgi:ATP-dependent Clp protease ATP-binding subunit ClpB
MVRVDASEYSSKNSISRLIGASPGYIGYEQAGQLTEFVRRRPYSIVLVDEIEKACDEFFDLFLQVLDDGRLTDGQGRTVNFKNTIIIMTSNLGGHFLNRVDDCRRIPHTTEKNVMTAIQSRFSAEFINRFDQTVFFVSHSFLAEFLR